MSQYPGYPQPNPPAYPPAYPPPAQTSTMAVVSLVAGIAAWLLVPLIGAIVAVITGHMARKEINNSMGQLTGGGMATAGLVLGYVQLALTVIFGCLAVCLIAYGALNSGSLR